jgi:hypothetical protein
MRVGSLLLAPTLSLALAGSVAAKTDSKQEQTEQNTARIEALEAETTLSDLECAPDEGAAFSGTGWVCRTPASLLSLIPFGSFSYRVVSSHLGSSARIWATSITVAAGTSTLDGAVYAYCLDPTPGG